MENQYTVVCFCADPEPSSSAAVLPHCPTSGGKKEVSQVDQAAKILVIVSPLSGVIRYDDETNSYIVIY